MRKDVMAGAAVGAALLGGAAYYYFRERAQEEPDFRALESDGDHQIRDYPALIVAETVVNGPRREALDEGHRVLADFLAAKSRDGDELPMLNPVIQDSGAPMASDPPLFDDDLEGAWRTRVVMPLGLGADELPDPPEGVELVELPARKVAVVSFSGRWTDALLREQEDRLRGWLSKRGVTSRGEPEYAFYNSPMVPGPLRRNELWLALS
ncbi:heme-binding protein [Sphingomonas sp. NSE70-1]|uniref:Heme-binding protein n=1 Tax=Sphingomonas caseinilyticus TaxID=2908205 RepID=A0ABT0RUR5_9SPHN|nr:heme-binding protein [Sphingomonas caseinilyticus]MCL6698743.1 heme-binding protein [Sphingomonas caseinilyticus]